MNLERREQETGPIEAWAHSEEGQRVFAIINGIVRFQHGSAHALAEVLGDDVRADLPDYGYEIEEFLSDLHFGREVDRNALQPEVLERFKQRLPIDDIHNAAFVLPTNRLLLSYSDTFFFPRGWEVESKIHELPEYKAGTSDYILGVTARVKSNGWRIFDTTGLNYIRGRSREFADGLLETGHIPLRRGVYRYELIT